MCGRCSASTVVSPSFFVFFFGISNSDVDFNYGDSNGRGSLREREDGSSRTRDCASTASDEVRGGLFSIPRCPLHVLLSSPVLSRCFLKRGHPKEDFRISADATSAVAISNYHTSEGGVALTNEFEKMAGAAKERKGESRNIIKRSLRIQAFAGTIWEFASLPEFFLYSISS